MTTELRFNAAAVSDVGAVRKDNQDSGFASSTVLAVADGVGGAARGDIASSVAIDALSNLEGGPDTGADRLESAVRTAHAQLSDIVTASSRLNDCSTTVTAVLVDGDSLHLAHVGDSRGYLLRDGELQQLTTDHTLVQTLVDEGRITADEARVHPQRNLILKALDGVHEPAPDLSSVSLVAGDRVMLCSDGCSGVLTEEQIREALTDSAASEAATRLVRLALDEGSTDNITVVIGDVTAEPVSGPTRTVGAAVNQPHLRIADESTGNLEEADLAELSEVPIPDDETAESLRYAPRPPRRFLWFRRLLVSAIGLAVIAGGLWYGYQWTQDQYYVGVSDEKVAIYSGVDVDMPWVELSRIEEVSAIEVDQLEEYDARQVRAGIRASSLEAARRVVNDLRVKCDEPPTQPGQKPGTTPTKSLTNTSTQSPRALAAPSTTAPTDDTDRPATSEACK